MYPRTEYEMSEDDLEKLLEACKPTPVMFLTGGVPIGGTPQENANHAWERLGQEMGFDFNTVQPIPGKGQRFFSAIPSETAEARKERQAREAIAHAGKHAFDHRRDKKGDFRRLWTVRINAALGTFDTSYSKFMGKLKEKNIKLNRKVLSEIAHEHPESFGRIVKESSSI